MEPCTNLHFTQSNASFGRQLAACKSEQKQSQPLFLVSPYIQKHSKTGPRSNGYHKSFCFVSKYCPWKKLGKDRQIFPPLLYFSLVTYHANISALTKVPNISVPVVCGGCRQYICVYFTCLSLLCSALLSLFTTFGEKLLSLSMLGSSPPHPPSLVTV